MPEPIDEPSGGLVEVTAALTSPVNIPAAPSPPLASSASSSSDRAVVQLPSGWRIEIPIGADANWVREMLQAMALMKV
jgi:hypothetical protein